MKIVDTTEYISALGELLAAGQTVHLPVAGNSMLPLLVHNRDNVTLERSDTPLKKGDIVLYQRQSGEYILHRICRVTGDGFYAVGDAQQSIEGPLPENTVLGRVTSLRRKGKNLAPGNFWWEFFEHIWIRLIPCRHFLMKLYGIRIPSGKGGRRG